MLEAVCLPVCLQDVKISAW